MDATDSPTATAPPPPQPPPPPVKCLTRSSRDKVLGGVAGGLGTYFSIDPLIFRIGFVALAFAGGSGLAIYLVAWLLLPDDAGGSAPVHSLSKGATHPAQIPVLLVIGGIVTIALINDHDHGLFDGIFWPLALIAAGVFLWTRKPTFGDPSRPSSPTGSPGPEPSETPDRTDSPGPAFTGDDATSSLPSDPTATWSATPPTDPPSPLWEPTPEPAPSGPRVHSITGSVMSLLLLVAGGAALLHTSGAIHTSVETVLAVLLVITGVALLGTTWVGRGRGLIAVAVALNLALALAATIDVPLRGGVGDRRWTPTSAASLDAAYRLGVGEAILDLTELDPEGLEGTRVVASVAVGHLVVLVPRSMPVAIDAHAGMGETVIFGQREGGIRSGREFRDRGPFRFRDREPVRIPEFEGRLPEFPPGTSEALTIDVRVGIGQVEVLNVAA